MRNEWPYGILRDTPDVDLIFCDVPVFFGGALYVRTPLGGIIAVDQALTQDERKERVGHELLHHLRGLTGDCTFDHRGIDDENARRLVPGDELHAMQIVAEANELTFEAWQVAEKFRVPVRVAERRMTMLLLTQEVTVGVR